jgi:hypothetical protein
VSAFDKQAAAYPSREIAAKRRCWCMNETCPLRLLPGQDVGFEKRDDLAAYILVVKLGEID